MSSYFVSLGSNINPVMNVTLMLQELLNISEKVDVSRIIETEPVGFESHNKFLNLSVRIETEKNPHQLKEYLNAIETQLGRDRTHINRKFQDRVADLDILFVLDEQEIFVDENLLPSEDYIKSPLVELIHFLELKCHSSIDFVQEGVEINMNNILIGKKPITLSNC